MMWSFTMGNRMGKFYYIFLLFLLEILFSEITLADDTYPYSVRLFQKIDGGKLFVVKNDTLPKRYTSYLIKPNWAEDTEIFQIWEGIEKKQAKGTSLTNTHILDVTAYCSDLLSIWFEEGKVFIALVDKEGDIVSISQLTSEVDRFTVPKARWLGQLSDSSYLLLVQKSLYIVNIDKNTIDFSLLNNNVIDAIPLIDSAFNPTIAVLTKKDALAFVSLYSGGAEKQIFESYQFSEELKLFEAHNRLLLVVQISPRLCHITRIELKTYTAEKTFWINSSISTIAVKDNYFYYLNRTEKGYRLSAIDLEKGRLVKSVPISESFIEPLRLQVLNDLIFIVFKNGIVAYNEDFRVNSLDMVPISEYLSQSPIVYFIDDYLIVSDDFCSLIFNYAYNNFWYVNSFYQDIGRYIIPAVLVIIIVIFVQLYRHQKRLFNELLNVPSVGAVIVTDKIGRVIIANESARKLLQIPPNAKLGKQISYYSQLSLTDPVAHLIENALKTQISVVEKITLIKGAELRDWLCNVFILKNIAGQLKGAIFVGVDITEELGRNKLSNWAMLAHDMQTNLSIIHLNAEMVEVIDNVENLLRKQRIINQIKILMNRVRDLVTVGKGNKLDKSKVLASELCNELISEFDSSAFPNVKFKLHLEEFQLNCDRLKLLRAFRNAVENSIKSFDNQEGEITISCWKKDGIGYFSIKDNGSGMDEQTLSKITNPYLNTSNSKSGSGIGTMIMQFVVELHKGELKINSALGKGTEVIFSIPIL